MKEFKTLKRKSRPLQFLNSHSAKLRKRKVLAIEFFLVMLSPLFLNACERKTLVNVAGGNPPTFVVSGSGELGEVIITKPIEEQSKDILDEKNILWKIAAVRMPGRAVEDVGSVTYGVTPPGYKQVVPEQGPAPILEGTKRYGYLFVTADAPHGAGHFEIRNGQAVLLP